MLDFFRDLFLTKIISAIVKWFKQLFSFIRKNKIMGEVYHEKTI